MTTTAVDACTEARADLTWLLHRSAQRLRATLDGVASAHGLQGVRDWVVLGALLDGPPRTQLALATELGVDKTTLTSLLDRLEADGLVVRSLVPHDRRARIPEATDRGRCVHASVTADRDRAEEHLLGRLSVAEQEQLRGLLARLADGSPGPTTCIEAC